MHRRISMLAVFMLALLTGCMSSERTIAIEDAPDIVIAAAQEAVPGLQITEVSIETEDDREVYEVEGTTESMEYEIEITAEGDVLEIEEEERDDDD